jgi:hypothetical protein
MPEYAHLTDDEILYLAEQRGEMTDEGKLSLDLELSRRNMTVADVQAYSAESQRLSETPDPSLFTARVYHPYGIGKKLFVRPIVALNQTPISKSSIQPSGLWSCGCP